MAANQHVSQLSNDLQHAVFGNAGTIVAFRLGAIDAPIVAAELGMDNPRALRETSNLRAWMRLMRDGTPLEPHYLEMLPLPPRPPSRLHRVIARTRSRHMLPRHIVEAQINAFFASVAVRTPKTKKRFRRADG